MENIVLKADKVVIGDSRITINKDGINIDRPDGVVWLQNGKTAN